MRHFDFRNTKRAFNTSKPAYRNALTCPTFRFFAKQKMPTASARSVGRISSRARSARQEILACPAGVEPAVFGVGVQRIIHCATGRVKKLLNQRLYFTTKRTQLQAQILLKFSQNFFSQQNAFLKLRFMWCSF